MDVLAHSLQSIFSFMW